MLSEILLFLVGLGVLTWGANLLVGHSVTLALRLKIRPIIIGTTIVALGTSLPEFVVAMTGQFTDAPGISLGSVVGSNSANIGLILGVAAIISPLAIQTRVLKVEYVAVFFTSLFLVFLAWDGSLSRVDGMLLAGVFLILFVAYVAAARRKSSRILEGEEAFGEIEEHKMEGMTRIFLGIAVGLAMLGGGAWLMVENAKLLARELGMSDAAIGITMVAVGTSIPELATCIVAAMKKQSDLAVGNILGSNIFNVLFVLGPAAMVKPLAVSEEIVSFDLPVMMAFTVILFPFMLTGRKLQRWEGFVLLVGYVVYSYSHFR